MSIIRFIVFILIFLSIFLGIHYLIYSSAIRFLGIIDPLTRRIIFWILVFLALSFFPSALLLRLHVNVLTSLLYHVSVIWMGLLIYLLMALALIWIVFVLGKLIGSVTDMRLTFLFFTLLALTIGVRTLLFLAARRRLQLEHYRQTRRADGQLYPPYINGVCEVCKRGGCKIYFPQGGVAMCPLCYEVWWREHDTRPAPDAHQGTGLKPQVS